MANFDFSELRAKAVETAGVIADKTAVMAKRAKLSSEIAVERDHLKKSYQTIGRLYFEKYGVDPDPDIKQYVDEAKISADKIKSKKEELSKLEQDEGSGIEVDVTIEPDDSDDTASDDEVKSEEEENSDADHENEYSEGENQENGSTSEAGEDQENGKCTCGCSDVEKTSEDETTTEEDAAEEKTSEPDMSNSPEGEDKEE